MSATHTREGLIESLQRYIEHGRWDEVMKFYNPQKLLETEVPFINNLRARVLSGQVVTDKQFCWLLKITERHMKYRWALRGSWV